MENESLNIFAENKLEETQNKNLNTKSETQNNKKSIKSRIIAALALILVGITALSFGLLRKIKNNKNNMPVKPNQVVTNVDDLGMEEELPKKEDNEKQYGQTTGDIKKEDLVEKDDTIWKDQNAADKSDEAGKVETDDKEGTLEVKPDGEVFEKEEDYEVKDEDGNVIDSGTNENGIPDGYAWDSVLNEYVKEDQVGKYMYVDATYYSQDGKVVFDKGEIVLKETFEKIKNELTIVKPEIKEPEEIIPEETPEEILPEEESTIGVINPDGTYTIYGTTYMDKATFESFVLDENPGQNFGYYEGVIYPVSVIQEMFQENQKSR